MDGLKGVIVLNKRCGLTFGRKQFKSVMAFPVLIRMEKPLKSDGIQPLIPYHLTPFAHYHYDCDAYGWIYRVHNYSHDMEEGKRWMLMLHSLHKSQVGIILLYCTVINMTDGDSQSVELHLHLDLHSHQHLIIAQA